MNELQKKSNLVFDDFPPGEKKKKYANDGGDDVTSSSDDDDVGEAESRYVTRLKKEMLLKLGAQPCDSLWEELTRRLSVLDIEGKVQRAGSDVVRITDVLPHR